jgi:hypothetical protein
LFISRSGELLALATQSGSIYILELKLKNMKDRERVATRITNHKDRVTALCWDATVSYHDSYRVICIASLSFLEIIHSLHTSSSDILCF